MAHEMWQRLWLLPGGGGALPLLIIPDGNKQPANNNE